MTLRNRRLINKYEKNKIKLTRINTDHSLKQPPYDETCHGI